MHQTERNRKYPIQLPPGEAARRVFQRMGLFDIARFRFIDRRMLSRRVADVVPGPQTAQHGADAGNDERHAPGIERGDQPRDHDRAERGTQRRAAVEQRRATPAFGLRHPDAVEFAAGRINRRFRGAQAEPAQQQDERVGRECGDRLKRAPKHRRQRDHDPRLEAIGQHAARHLHERVGPEERTQDQTLPGGIDAEFFRDQRHRDRERGAVDVIHRDQKQHQEKDFPAHAARSGGACRRDGLISHVCPQTPASPCASLI